MFRIPLLSLTAMTVLSAVPAAPVPKEQFKPTGILVLDDCDPLYKGKLEYDDNLTLLDSAGKKSFRISGFNNCQSAGSSRAIAADASRDCIWVVENVAHRIRRFDRTGKLTQTIADVNGTAIAVDPVTGHLWALVGDGRIVNTKVAVFDGQGKEVTSYTVGGCDIAYDRVAKAFWIAGKVLTKIDSVKGKVLFSNELSTWGAAMVDTDPKSGAAWVAVRKHPDVKLSENRLLKFTADGKESASVDLDDKIPFRVSVDPKDGSVWLARLRKSVLHYSGDGKFNAEHSLEALAVQVDPAGGDVWVVTTSDVQKMSPQGKTTAKLAHAGKTGIAWITTLE